MDEFTIERIYLKDKKGIPVETLGSWYDESRNIVCKTMELPYRDNKVGKTHLTASCIPEGRYIFEKQPPNENRKYGYFRARAIPGRTINQWFRDLLGNPMSSILVHRITMVKDLLGCIGVGSRFHDFNKDGIPDMAESSVKLEWMYKNLPDVFVLNIKEKK